MPNFRYANAGVDCARTTHIAPSHVTAHFSVPGHEGTKTRRREAIGLIAAPAPDHEHAVRTRPAAAAGARDHRERLSPPRLAAERAAAASPAIHDRRLVRRGRHP